MSNTTSWSKEETKSVYFPCQNCGNPVLITLPFVGCVFCGDCVAASSPYDATTEWDKKQYRVR